jgi:hypothetical protein
MNNKLQIISVFSKNDIIGLNIFVNSLLAQTNKNWLLNLIHNGVPTAETCNLISLYQTKCDLRFQYMAVDTGYWGHVNRKKLLDETNTSEGDFLLITNHDSYYMPVMVEHVLNVFKEDIDLVYFDFIHSHQGYQYYHSEPFISKIDWGAFVTRTEVAKKSGLNNTTHYCADGIFLEDYKKVITKGMVHIPLPLYVHN